MEKIFTLCLVLILSGLSTQAQKVLVVETDLSMAKSAKTELLATGLFTADDIDAYDSKTDPSTIAWEDYDALLYWSNQSPDRIIWGNAIADFIDDGGGVVDGVFELQSSQSTYLLGAYTDDYQVVVRGDVQYGTGGTMDSVIMPDHPIMENVSSVQVTDYTADLHELQTNAYTIAKYTDDRILAAARENVGAAGARRVSLNIFPPGIDWIDTTDVGVLMANSLIWVSNMEISGEQKATVGIPDTISFNMMENDTIVQWYKKSIDGEWAEYGEADTSFIEAYNEPDTIFYKIKYLRNTDTITSKEFIVIAKYAQTIELPNLREIALDQEDYAPGAIASSDLSVSYSSSNTGIANIIDDKIHPEMLGTCFIYVNQEGDNNYWPATEVSDTLTIKAASQTITFDALVDKTYGDADFEPVAAASSDLDITFSSSDTSIASIVDGNIHIKMAGSCTIYANQPGNDTLIAAEQGEQMLQINQAIAVLSISDTMYIYDGTAQSVSITTDPAGLTSAVTYDGSETAPTDAGTYQVIATIVDSNYEGADTTSFEISKAIALVTISDAAQEYDGSAKSVTTDTDPAGLKVAVTYDGSETAPTDAGTYQVIATIVDSNYEGTDTTSFEITGPNSINNISITTINVFPNPIVNTLNIEVSNDLIRNVSVYTITGKQVFEQRYSARVTQVDFTQFNTGVYFIRIKTNKEEFVEKVVK